MKHLSRLALILLLCLTLWDCGPAEKSVFRIGFLADYDTPGGQPSVNAAEMAVAEINQAGGVVISGTPHHLALVIKDTHNNPSDAMDAARALLFQENVRVLIGPNVSRNAIPVASVAESAGVPMISPGSTNPQTTRGKKYVFRMAFMDDLQGRTMAGFARDNLQADTAAILFDAANPSIQTVAQSFRHTFESRGGRVVAYETYATGETKFQGALARLSAAHPDLVFLPNYVNDLTLQAHQLRQLNPRAQILGSDAWSPHKISGETALEGAWFCHHWDPSLASADPANRRFVAEYRRRFGEEPKVMSALTYDALGFLAEVLKESDGSAADIREVLAHSGYEGITGSINFSESGDPAKSLMILRLIQGRVIFQNWVAPVPGRALVDDGL